MSKSNSDAIIEEYKASRYQGYCVDPKMLWGVIQPLIEAKSEDRSEREKVSSMLSSIEFSGYRFIVPEIRRAETIGQALEKLAKIFHSEQFKGATSAAQTLLTTLDSLDEASRVEHNADVNEVIVALQDSMQVAEDVYKQKQVAERQEKEAAKKAYDALPFLPTRWEANTYKLKAAFHHFETIVAQVEYQAAKLSLELHKLALDAMMCGAELAKIKDAKYELSKLSGEELAAQVHDRLMEKFATAQEEYEAELAAEAAAAAATVEEAEAEGASGASAVTAAGGDGAVGGAVAASATAVTVYDSEEEYVKPLGVDNEPPADAL